MIALEQRFTPSDDSVAMQTVLVSGNGKVGAMPVTSSTRNTCPPSCPLFAPPKGKKASPCYYFGGYYTGMQAKRLAEQPEKYHDTESFIGWIRSLPVGGLWRDRIGGDQVSETGNRERIDAQQLRAVHKANKKRKRQGFGFTHYDANDSHNRSLILEGYQSGYVLNASANSLSEGVALKKAYPSLQVAAVVPADYSEAVDTIDGIKAVQCLATTEKGEANGITCLRCGLCAKERDFIILFPAHGTGKAGATAIANLIPSITIEAKAA